MSRPPQPDAQSLKPILPRLSLRTKAVLVLWTPMAVMCLTVFSMYWREIALEKADQREIEEYRIPADALARIRMAEAVRLQHLRALAIAGLVVPLGALAAQLFGVNRATKRLRLVGDNAARLAHGMPLQPLGGGVDEIARLGCQIEEAARLLRESERELGNRERRYRNLFDRAPVPYGETDREGVVRHFNQELCNLLKCGPDRIMGSCVWDFVVPDQREKFRAAMLSRIANASETGPFECECRLGDGSTIAVEIRESLIQDEGGEVTGALCSLLDVTERKLAAVAARKVAQYAMELRDKNEQLAHALEAARSATEAKSRFLANVSHELRTPLNGIIGFSELLYDGKLGDVGEDRREIVGDILSSARHLLRLIGDILDLSKVEAGRMEFRPELSPLDPLVQEVRDVIAQVAERKGVRLATDVPAGLSAVLDRARFKQVLYNYLSNAVKFTPEGGNVWVRIRPAGACFRLEVEDTGIGIPAEEASKLFQDFQQLSNVRRNDQGSGLGLALTRYIVEAQGGAVEVRSTPGKGSIFSAVLPLTPRPPAAVS